VALFISTALIGVLFYLLSTDLESLARETEEIKAYTVYQNFIHQRLSTTKDATIFLKNLEKTGSQDIYYQGYLLRWQFIVFRPFSNEYLKKIKVSGLEEIWDKLLSIEARERIQIKVIKLTIKKKDREILQTFLSPQGLYSRVSSTELPPQFQ